MSETFNSLKPGTGRPGSAHFSPLIQMLLLAVAYIGAAKLGILLASLHGSISPVWPATGLSIGALVFLGIRRWPGIALGALLAEISFSPMPTLAAAGLCVGNTLEAVAGAMIVIGLGRTSARLGSLTQPLGFILASALAPVISASCGVASLVLTGDLPWANAAPVWETWWVGDALGALMLVPALMSLPEVRRWLFADFFKFLTLLLITVLVGGLVFLLPNGSGFLFGLFPLLLLAVAWLGSPGVKWVAVAIAAIALGAAFTGARPFTADTLNEELLRLQLFLTSVAAAALFLPVIRAAGNLKLPGLVLMAGWLLSGSLFYFLQNERFATDSQQLEQLSTEAQTKIAQRMEIYTDSLRAGVALFAESKSVTRAEWRAFADSLRLHKRYPGINGIGVIYRVPAGDVSNFLASVRADGAPDFAIHDVANAVRPTDGPNGHEYFLTTYLEPQTNSVTQADNAPVLGLDNASETNRWSAAMMSATTGRPRITERIELMPYDQHRAGFLLYLPFYHNGASVKRLSQRKSELEGWVYAPIITTNFINGIFTGTNRVLQFSFFNGKSTRAKDLLYTTPGLPEKISFERVSQIVLGGKSFTIGWNRGPAFVVAGTTGALWAAVSSALVSLLLAGLVIVLQSVNRRATELAGQRTVELSLANAALREGEKVQRRLNGQLAETLMLQNAILGAANYSIVSTTTTGVVTSFNATSERWLGYTAAEVVGRATPALWHDAAEVAARANVLSFELGRPVEPGFEVFVAKARPGRVDENEWTLIRKDGSRFPVTLSATALVDGEGAITGFLGVIADISERKAAQEKSAWLATFPELNPNPVVELDLASDEVLYANPTMDRLLPDLKNLGTRHPFLAGLPELKQKLAGGGAEAVRREVAVGGLFFAQIITCVPTAGRIRIYGSDITERKRAEAALRNGEERFRHAFDDAPIGIGLVSPAGRWLRVNRALCAMLGYAEAEFLVTDFQHITHPEDLKKDWESVQRVLAGTIATYQMEKRYFHKTGTVIHVMLSVSLVRDGAGEPLYFVSQIENITERKISEAKIVQSLREKEALLREIHHRVKNNMQVISSILQLQTKYIKDPALLDVFKDCQGRIRTMGLIHEKLYRSEGLAQIDFKEYLESLVGLLLRSHTPKGVTLRNELQIAPVNLDVDTAIPLGLIANELVCNCLKHAFTGRPAGQMRISLSELNPGRLQLEVSDDGKGLPPGFDPDNTGSLGVRLVKILSGQINGKLEFKGDAGTRFTIGFDVAQPKI